MENVREIKQLRAAETSNKDTASLVQNLRKNTVLVDAWENTPVDDLKKLPWEEMLSTSEKHLEAYRAWKAAADNNNN